MVLELGWATPATSPRPAFAVFGGDFMHLDTNQYEVSDACPESLGLGTQKDFDEKYEKWKIKQANEPPTWQWIADETQ